jgi:sterol desaturase/sphingolipid hydroxylase (fatty acid hydroxylase superfamily)
MNPPNFASSRGYSVNCLRVLRVLCFLFAFRVIAQLVQRLAPVSFLPPDGAWHSGSLPYSLLLTLQILLLIVMALTQVKITRGMLVPRPTVGTGLLSLGAVYFAFMLFRFGAAFTFGAGHPFLGVALPAFFHLVLSAWILVLGFYHHQGSADSPCEVDKLLGFFVSWLAYPLLILGGLWLHLWMRSEGCNLLLSTYGPLGSAALVITWLELRFPHRAEWKPDAEEVKNDLSFMVLVQIILPKMLAFFLAVTAVRWVDAWGIAIKDLWPHDISPFLQAGLMLLLADLLRYVLHRASHEWNMSLWSLHAVHHSPEKLYWFNVGRFHPLEKSLQFVLDAAPFILLGVTEEVLAIYFVFYAVNGFLQHCNIRLHLGWLNYLISGPELHRWHHSWEIRESNKNYGNNIILWDLLFGSFFLPHDREVDLLGLKNRRYPRDFLSQMRTPFIKGLDKHEP